MSTFNYSCPFRKTLLYCMCLIAVITTNAADYDLDENSPKKQRSKNKHTKLVNEPFLTLPVVREP